MRNRVTSIAHKTSAHSTISSESYEYDAAGNLVEKTVNSVTTEYAYDDIDQLVSEVRSGYSASYTYDANGNRASKTLNGTTQTYVVDDADKLTSITQGGNTVKSFTYDAAGRTTAVTVGNDTTSVAYDYESRITQITYPNQSTNTFAYNGLDTRVSKVDSTGTRTYLRDGAYVTDPVLSDGAATYTPRISERRSSVTKFYHPDRLGTTERLTDTSQNTTDTRQYDAFGLLTSSSGTWKGLFAYGGPYGYQSDPDSGLKLQGHRYYDSSTGRFLTRDPAKDGRNWYGYCENNPGRAVDPNGLHTLVFSGRKLKWFDDSGQLVDITDGVSGIPGSRREDQNKKDQGPIPEGEYFLNPDEDRYSTSKYNVFGRLFGMGEVLDPVAWGDRIIPIHPGKNTDTFGRKGMFLHGGDNKGSIGCIDIGHADKEWIDRIGKHKGRVKLIVDYSQWTGETPDGKW